MSIIETTRSTKGKICLFPARRTAPLLYRQSDMKKVIAHLALNISICLAAVSTVAAQGWERVLSTKGGEDLYDVVASPDGGYLTVGQYDGLNQILLIKTYADGRLQWTKRFSTINNVNKSGRSLAVAADGSIYITGYSDGFGLDGKDIVLLKTDPEGNLLWQNHYGTQQAEEAFSLVPTTDGGLLIAGTRDFNPNKDILLLKTDADGGLVWEKTFWEKTFGSPTLDEQAYSLTLLPDGGVAVVGSVKQSVNLDVLVIRTDAAGEKVWEWTYGLSASKADEAYKSVLTDDGKLVVAGYTNLIIGSASLLIKMSLNDPDSLDFVKLGDANTIFNGLAKTSDGGFFTCGTKEIGANVNLFVSKFDEDGGLIWERDFGTGGPEFGEAVVEAPDGGAVVAGEKYPYLSGNAHYAYLVKTDPDGNIFTDQISGNVFHDFNDNCTKDVPTEPGLQDWIIKVTKPGEFDRYAVSDANGFYKTQVDTGTYQVQLYRPNAYWQLFCQPNGYTTTLTDFYDTATVNIPVKAKFACAWMRVDVVTPVLVRCEQNEYAVSYCNEGTIPAVNAKVEVTLDEGVNYLSSSVPATLVGGSTYSFDLGFVANGQCGSFTVNTFLDCDTELGATRCVTAHAYPDTFCKMAFPDWDGSILEATGKCDSGKVQFTLTNVGTEPMGKEGNFIVIEDVYLLTAPGGDTLFDFDPLQPNVPTKVWEAPANGSTRRIIAFQTPGYPGPSIPTAAVEGCTTDTSQTASLGYWTAFPDDESEPFKASDCQEVLGENPGTTKIGHPKGVGPEHWITDSTDLEYLIQFQNTGTDTVHSVEVRDTLSPWLDPTTVRAGAGSAPFDFEVYDGGIVLFRIPQTDLFPVGSAGGGPSSGYVHFRVSQKPITPCDTTITNRAAIYFDNKNPVTTNEVRRKVCHDITHFVTVTTNMPTWPGAKVEVFPNPFTEFANFQIKEVNAKRYTFEVFDAAGKRVLTNTHKHPDFRLDWYQLSPGVFFYRLSADGKPVASGKVVAQ